VVFFYLRPGDLAVYLGFGLLDIGITDPSESHDRFPCSSACACRPMPCNPDRIMTMFGSGVLQIEGGSDGVFGLTGASRERTDLRARPGVAIGDQISDGSVWQAPPMPELLAHTAVNGNTDLNTRM
jgi:hypothetical protein